MSIIVNLDDMLYKRRMTLTELSERIGITLSNLSVLKTGKARAIRFSTLDAICTVLQCQPSDLLAFAPASPATSTDAAAAPGDKTETAL
jgi:putative transcriptional regulator